MNKIILITGASSGIGFDSAKALARRGHKVYAGARRVEKMDELRQFGVTPLSLDVTDEDSMTAAVQEILKTEGRIDVLVNNAGYGFFGAVETTPPEEARRQLDVNVFGLARMCQLVLPGMRERGSGRIVNIASVAGRSVFPFGAWYCVSKYSVEAFSDALRMEMRPFGVDVSVIEPGPIRTPWGIIAASHLEDTTASTVYEGRGLKQAETFRWAYGSKILPKPSAVTRRICRAALSRHPRTRYRAGFGAGFIIAMHALLPTRWWDALTGVLSR